MTQMRDQKKTNIKVGIIVAVAIILFIWVLGWAKNFSIYSDNKDLIVRFSNVSGLELGDPVTVNGVRKGFVDDIKVDQNSALVKLSIDDDVLINDDAEFKILMLDLMGGKKIDIMKGISNNKLDFSKIHTGEFAGDVPTVMAMLGSVQSDLVNIIKEVQISLTSLNNVITDEDFNSDLKKSVNNLSDLTAGLNKVLLRNQSNIDSLIINSNKFTKEANELIAENKNEINESFNNLNEMIIKTDALIVKLNAAFEETANQKNNLGKLLYDENLLADIKETLANAKELTKILNQQLKGKGVNVDANINLF